MFAIDIDGDGDVDVLSAFFYDGTIVWYENLNGRCGTMAHIYTYCGHSP